MADDSRVKMEVISREVQTNFAGTKDNTGVIGNDGKSTLHSFI